MFDFLDSVQDVMRTICQDHVETFFQRFRFVLLRAAPSTNANRIRALYGYARYIYGSRQIAELHRNHRLAIKPAEVLDSSSILDYTMDVAHRGYSWSSARDLGTALDAVVAVQPKRALDDHSALLTQQPWWKLFARAAHYRWRHSPNRTVRRGITEDMAKALADSPPMFGSGGPTSKHHVSAFQWKVLIVISWVFGLRKQEVLHVQRDHIYMQYSKHQNCNRWFCTVARPKIQDADNSQRVALNCTLVPDWCHDILARYLDSGEEFMPIWQAAFTKQSCCPWIRYALGVGDDKGFVFHSVRHGRAAHLFKQEGIGLQEILEFGRWRSERSTRMYLHAW